MRSEYRFYKIEKEILRNLKKISDLISKLLFGKKFEEINCLNEIYFKDQEKILKTNIKEEGFSLINEPIIHILNKHQSDSKEVQSISKGIQLELKFKNKKGNNKKTIENNKNSMKDKENNQSNERSNSKTNNVYYISHFDNVLKESYIEWKKIMLKIYNKNELKPSLFIIHLNITGWMLSLIAYHWNFEKIWDENNIKDIAYKLSIPKPLLNIWLLFEKINQVKIKYIEIIRNLFSSIKDFHYREAFLYSNSSPNHFEIREYKTNIFSLSREEVNKIINETNKNEINRNEIKKNGSKKKSNGENEYNEIYDKELIQYHSIYSLFSSYFIYYDLFGRMYQLLLHSTLRLSKGEYYTPQVIAKKIVEKNYHLGNICLDPACGSGSFLIATIRYIFSKPIDLSRKIEYVNMLYGFDINPFSVALAKANILLLIPYRLSSKITLNIYNKDFLDSWNKNYNDSTNYSTDTKLKIPEKFDLIFGNPPWIVANQIPSEEERNKIKFLGNKWNLFLGGRFSTTTEIAAIFWAKAIRLHLYPGGRLCYIIPASFANAAQHQRFRQFPCSVNIEFWSFTSDIFPIHNLVLVAQKPTTNSVKYYKSLLDPSSHLKFLWKTYKLINLIEDNLESSFEKKGLSLLNKTSYKTKQSNKFLELIIQFDILFNFEEIDAVFKIPSNLSRIQKVWKKEIEKSLQTFKFTKKCHNYLPVKIGRLINYHEEIPLNYSDYSSEFRQGASFVPRNLLFIEWESIKSSFLGSKNLNDLYFYDIDLEGLAYEELSHENKFFEDKNSNSKIYSSHHSIPSEIEREKERKKEKDKEGRKEKDKEGRKEKDKEGRKEKEIENLVIIKPSSLILPKKYSSWDFVAFKYSIIEKDYIFSVAKSTNLISFSLVQKEFLFLPLEDSIDGKWVVKKPKQKFALRHFKLLTKLYDLHKKPSARIKNLIDRVNYGHALSNPLQFSPIKVVYAGIGTNLKATVLIESNIKKYFQNLVQSPSFHQISSEIAQNNKKNISLIFSDPIFRKLSFSSFIDILSSHFYRNNKKANNVLKINGALSQNILSIKDNEDSKIINNDFTFVDTSLYYYVPSSLEEAFYLVGYLNSPYISKLVQKVGSTGQNGSLRNIHKHPFDFGPPLFNADNHLHMLIADKSYDLTVYSQTFLKQKIDGDIHLLKHIKTLKNRLINDPVFKMKLEELDILIKQLIS